MFCLITLVTIISLNTIIKTTKITKFLITTSQVTGQLVLLPSSLCSAQPSNQILISFTYQSENFVCCSFQFFQIQIFG